MKFVRTLKEGGKIEDLKKVEHVLKKHSIKLAYLFGSFSKGKVTKFSDVDIAVLFVPEADKDLDRLRVDLMNTLGMEAIDLIDLENAPLKLKYHIIKDGKILIGEKNSTKFEVKTMLKYFDFKPVEEKYFEKMEERIESGEFGQQR